MAKQGVGRSPADAGSGLRPFGAEPAAQSQAKPLVPNARRVPLLSELREQPVVGRFYMVPVVEQAIAGRMSDWPVLGPKHTDIELFPNFPWAHYHLDGRFLTKRQQAIIGISRHRSLENRVGNVVPFHSPEHKALLPNGRPALRKRLCQRAAYGYAYGKHDPIQRLREQYGDPVEPRRLADGRLLCPHRKVDLSSFPPDADGVVVCPLHGLRVQCAPARGMSAGTAKTPKAVEGVSPPARSEGRAQ